MQAAISQQNWVAGELSPYMRGRYDLPAFQNGAERMVNFIAETAGVARYRSGTQFVNPTRRGQPGCLLPFQFNDAQAYELEFTQGYIRFYQSDQVLTLAPVSISGGITNANPGVVTAASHGFSNGDEVIINGVVGMPRMNNQNFVVSSVTTNTFQLNDFLGNPVDTTSFGTYISGGTCSKIYEIQSPYNLVDLFALKFGQNADVLYIVHPNYEPMKLTRMGNTSWTIAKFDRTADPFLTKVVISGVTQANPGVVTATAHGYTAGQKIIINEVTGMTQLNNSVTGHVYTVAGVTTNTFTLIDETGTPVNTIGYTAYVSGGYASDKTLLPGAFCFYQGRSQYGYADQFPESWWGSQALDSSGNPQYDDFTTGSNPVNSYKFTLSPITGKVDKIESLVPTLNFLAICTFEGISKADGDSAGDPISPSTVDVSPAVTYGCLQQVTPILLGITMVYIHRSGLIMYSLEYDIFYNAYNAMDKNLSSEHITQSGVKQMVFRNGRPPMFMYCRNDGVLVGVTYMVKENINGAHRHILGGPNAKVLSVGNMPRSNAYDQTWVIVQRVINGQTVCYVEYINDEQIFPELDDYYTGDNNQASDLSTWQNVMFETQKQYVFTDCNATYDGSNLFETTITPGATTGNGITFTAGASIFTAAMVGQEIWKKSITGVETGRATITAYVSGTQVTCNITSNFDSTSVIAEDNWYLTTNVVNGLWYLEGQTIKVLTDGGQHADQTVLNGSINLEYQASTVQCGFGYLGLLRSMNLESGGVNGPAQTKPKNINRIGIHFINTLGARFGSSLYDLQDVEFRQPTDLTGRPSPVYSGVQYYPFEDTTSVEKHIYIVQDKPLPCTVALVEPYADTDNE